MLESSEFLYQKTCRYFHAGKLVAIQYSKAGSFFHIQKLVVFPYSKALFYIWELSAFLYSKARSFFSTSNYGISHRYFPTHRKLAVFSLHSTCRIGRRNASRCYKLTWIDSALYQRETLYPLWPWHLAVHPVRSLPLSYTSERVVASPSFANVVEKTGQKQSERKRYRVGCWGTSFAGQKAFCEKKKTNKCFVNYYIHKLFPIHVLRLR